MQKILSDTIQQYLKQEHSLETEVAWSIPEANFGDSATNVALASAKQLSLNPRDIAESLAEHIHSMNFSEIKTIDVAGPGFINITYSDSHFDDFLSSLLQDGAHSEDGLYEGKKVVTEFSDPNAFKNLHVGHLYSSIIGDVISRIISFTGGNVVRTNFGGDVGLHVAKSMWGIKNELESFTYDALVEIEPSLRPQWLSERYVVGTNAYETDETAKAEIIDMNTKIYALHEESTDTAFAKVYWEARRWSYEYFVDFYKRIDVHFDQYMPESENAQLGLEKVREHIGDVYLEDDGAVIFPGETYDLHNRVFINSKGLPTYETKDVGVAVAKWQRYKFDESIIISGNEIIEYMKVVKKSMESYLPEAVQRTRHITHGHVKIKGAGKMSSRTGNVLKAEDVLSETKSKVESQLHSEQVMLAAIRYSFLKQRIGDDIQFDIDESVKITGNSGPYLQYALVRAKSILEDAPQIANVVGGEFEPDERMLLRELSHFPAVITESAELLEPHKLCTYLYDLAQQFNKFYENNRILDSEREQQRLAIVQGYCTTLQAGLSVLGIPILQKM